MATDARAQGPGDVESHLLGRALSGGGLGVANMVAGLAVAILLARELGPDGYGIYAFALSLSMLLAIPAQLGMPSLLVREIAKLQGRQRWGLLRGLLLGAGLVVALLSLALCLVAGVVAWAVYGHRDTVKLETVLWALPLIPLLASVGLRAAMLYGLRRVALGQLPELLVRATFVVALAAWLGFAGVLPPQTAMALHALAALLAFFVAAALVRRAIPPPVRLASPEYATSEWLRSIVPFSLLAGMHVIYAQADIVILGMFATNEEVGIYRIAVQGAMLVALPALFVGATIAPAVSRLFDAGDLGKIERVAAWAARVALVAALAVAAAFALVGEQILGFVFGEGYRASYGPLLVLSLGHVLCAALGVPATVLNMTGHERRTARGIALAVFTNVVLNLLLVPTYGATGAAAATAISLVVGGVVLSRTACLELGVRTWLALGRRRS